MSEESKILIIDASPLFQTTLEELILRKHPRVRIRKTGKAEDALAIAAKQRPDLILMDINLTDANGIKLPGQLAAKVPQARIVVITTSDAMEYRDALLDNGADYFISKLAADFDFILKVVDRQLIRPDGI